MLKDKVIVITGASRGIGEAIARAAVDAGARVALASRKQADLDQVASSLPAERAIAVACHTGKPGDVDAMFARAIERFGRVDGLVNNAGKSAAGRVEQVSDEEWTEDLSLKVLAAARCTRLAVPHLAAAGGGAIVNVLNIGSKAPGAGSLPTAASRAAGLALTKAASRDLGGQGIRVNAILIGLVESGQWRRRAAAAGQSEDEFYRKLAQGGDIPLGRVGRAEEFADLAAYLLSDRASYVTGSAINLDGGSSPVL